MFLGEKIRQEKTLDKSWINKNQRAEAEAEAEGKYPTKFEGIKNENLRFRRKISKFN